MEMERPATDANGRNMKPENGEEFNMKELLNYTSESLLVINTEGDLVFFNEVASRNNPILREPLAVGRSLFDVLPAERSDYIRFLVNEVATKMTSETTESEYKHPGGGSHFFETTLKPMLAESGVVEGICIIGRDITHQKTFERKSSALFTELYELMESANAIIFSLDRSGYVTEWNKESARITGYEKDDILAQQFANIIADQHSDSFNTVLDSVRLGNAVSNLEFKMTSKWGKPLSILLNATPRWNAGRNVIGTLFVGQDITELSDYRASLEVMVDHRTQQLKQAIEKEKELVDQRNRFISIASHELKIPISTISSAVNFLKALNSMNAEAGEKISSIEKQVSHMRSLLEDVLTIEKTEITKLKPNYQRVDIVSFLKEIAQEVIAGAQGSHKITEDFSDPEVLIDSDEKLLRNIFINLLSNAVKFSPLKDEVMLSVRKEKASVFILIQDFGIGIEETDLDRIFQPFNRGSNVGKIKGTGLGLSIVRKAVETLGGTLSVKSQSGKGTQFIITFKDIISKDIK
jgi:PAS domain S-box-containing protein